MLAFDKGVDDALMTRLTRRGQIAKMNLTFGISVGINANVRFGLVLGGRIAAVTFFARNADLFMRGRMPLEIAIAQGYRLSDLGVASYAIVLAIIGALRGKGCLPALRPDDRK